MEIENELEWKSIFTSYVFEWAFSRYDKEQLLFSNIEIQILCRNAGTYCVLNTPLFLFQNPPSLGCGMRFERYECTLHVLLV